MVEVVAGLAEAYRGGGVSSTELGHGGLLRSRGGGAAEAGSEGEGAGEWRTRTRWRPSSEAGARARSVGARRCPAVAGRVVAIGPDTVAAGGVGPTCHRPGKRREKKIEKCVFSCVENRHLDQFRGRIWKNSN